MGLNAHPLNLKNGMKKAQTGGLSKKIAIFVRNPRLPPPIFVRTQDLISVAVGWLSPVKFLTLKCCTCLDNVGTLTVPYPLVVFIGALYVV
jgi:hypothetical protein